MAGRAGEEELVGGGGEESWGGGTGEEQLGKDEVAENGSMVRMGSKRQGRVRTEVEEVRARRRTRS